MENIFVIKTLDQTIADAQQITNSEFTLKAVGIKFGVQKGKTPIFTWHFDLKNAEDMTDFHILIHQAIKTELIKVFQKRGESRLLNGFSFEFIHLTFDGGKSFLPLDRNHYNHFFK